MKLFNNTVGALLIFAFAYLCLMPTQPPNDPWFQSVVVQSSRPVLVKFGAEWCPPCQAMEPVLDDLASQMSSQVKVIRIDVETALEMQSEVEKALPSDVAIMVAAVADWRATETPDQKIKKDGKGIPPLTLTENPDILASLAQHKNRPGLLIGFAAETEKIVEHAQAKLSKKGCDWIVANDVSGDVMGGANNAFHIVTKDGVESWPDSPKDVIARKLMERVAHALAQG